MSHRQRIRSMGNLLQLALITKSEKCMVMYRSQMESIHSRKKAATARTVTA